jgi:hypothetical protein
MLLMLALFSALPSFSQVSHDKCRPNIGLTAFIDTVSFKYDSARPPGTYIRSGSNLRMRVNDSLFTVVSFVMIIDQDEDIIEIPVAGPYLSATAINFLRQAPPGSTVYFNCIQVQHKSGKFFSVKNFSVTRRLLL